MGQCSEFCGLLLMLWPIESPSRLAAHASMNHGILQAGQNNVFSICSPQSVTLEIVVRKRRYDIPVPNWTCRHCGFVHRSADLLRASADELICKNCGQRLPSISEKGHSEQ